MDNKISDQLNIVAYNSNIFVASKLRTIQNQFWVQ